MQDSLKFIVETATENVERNLSPQAISALKDQLHIQESALEAAYEQRVSEQGPPQNIATSKVWFMEKVVGAVSFAQMAVDPSIREAYSPSKILENVHHYAHLVESRWESW